MIRGSRHRVGVVLASSVLLLSACASEVAVEDDNDISAEARAALPEGIGVSDVARDLDGCYAYFDKGDQWVRPLLDSQEKQICD